MVGANVATLLLNGIVLEETTIVSVIARLDVGVAVVPVGTKFIYLFYLPPKSGRYFNVKI